ncbi:MAG: DUF2341 domain-containing protein [Chitinivibrionales bacterium]|nr:DUF2341 domain-containing protein [Chitinivibrionales bacterium]
MIQKPNFFAGMVFVALFAVALLPHCSSQDRLAGTATQSGNGMVAGMIVNADGSPAALARVRLVPVVFDPVAGQLSDSLSAITDSAGKFGITVTDSGVYNVEAVHRSDFTRGLVRGVRAGVPAPTDTLHVPGAIVVDLPDTADTLNGYVYLQGTTRFAPVTGNGRITLDSIPPGLMPTLYYAVRNSASVKVMLAESLLVPSGGSIRAPYPAWPFFRKISLNTTASGAGVAGTLTGFPVLVRLTSSNFNFGEAAPNGADLRFAKADGTPLPYEIERWDATAGAAEIWVLVDTVVGNSSAQFLTMYWGNVGATSVSNSAAVFDTVYGWAAVWHLEEEAPGVTADTLYKNAVEHADYGNDRVVSAGKSGLIGRGQSFSKGDKIQVAGASRRLKPQTLTVSAWVKLSALDSAGSDAVSMGDNYILRLNKDGFAEFDFFSVPDSTMTISADSINKCDDSAWHYLAGTYDGGNLKLYVDGVLRAQVPFAGPVPYNPGHNDFIMGSHGFGMPGYDFTGSIDEVECAAAVRSADWIRLCFMNQRQQNALLTFK